MARYYPQMQAFLNYIRTRKAGTGADAHIVDAALGDWIAAETTSGRVTGTWGYHQVADRMAKMAALLGRRADAAEYRSLADDIATAFTDAFYNETLGLYTSQGRQGSEGRHRPHRPSPSTRAWCPTTSARECPAAWSS
ncbi:hypothetical protein AB0O67_32320 [Streptomyces sp. NPDC086077]|uniref:alpha-L-rhamnosidase-related protein n=1 Tax=Streptomyces sp. NPDC086077 TaxID=3154862 RepID=UPI0034458FE3